MLKKPLFQLFICLVLALQLPVSAQNGGRAEGTDQAFRDSRIPALHARLVAAIKRLKLRPDAEGVIVFTMKSGARFDPIDRVWQVHSTKAKATMAQDRIVKLVFEYYQFNMSNNVREEKIFISTSPDSGDLRTLQMKYSSNDGEAMQYTVGDLQKSESQKALAGQYYSNYLTLVFLVEQYGSRSARKESQRIDRTIQLGE